MPYTHILAATDFSTLGNQAVAQAFEESVHHQATLSLIHVLQHPDTEAYHVRGPRGEREALAADLGVPLSSPRAPVTIRRDYVEEALTQLRDLVPNSFTGTWDVAVESGNPADEIVRVAQERNVDLVVMGTHGRTGLAHVLLGSVAEKVVRSASCSVLVVRSPMR
jgi:nucleotide-binding universal stress UspA family protein